MTKTHLAFIELEGTGKKTKTFTVKSAHDGSEIGMVKWYSGWRQFCFFPETDYDTMWSFDCLLELARFVREQNDAHKLLVKKA